MNNRSANRTAPARYRVVQWATGNVGSRAGASRLSDKLINPPVRED